MHVDGQVGDDERRGAGVACIGVEALPPVRLEQRGVRHRDERDADLAADRAQVLEALGGAHARGEGTLRSAPDHRAVRERIREREADLDQVGAACLGGARELRRLGARP